VTTGDPNSENDNTINEYSPRKADEAFLCGTSRHVKQQVQAAARTMDITSAQAKEDYTFASFGESGLRVLDALIRAGDMTGRELVEETGKKPSAIGTACRRLREHGLIEATRPNAITAYTYSLADNVWERLDAIAPHLRSYKLQAQREDRRLVSAVQWSQKELTKAQEPAVKHRLNLRIEKLSAQRIPHLARLHEELPADEVKRLAYEVGTPYGPHPATQAKLERYHADARMDVAESQRAEQWQLTKTAEQLRSDGDGKKDAVHKLTLAGYIPNEAWTAVQQVWGSGRASV
jgi:DNA-binding MarR family transcriptional regulator